MIEYKAHEVTHVFKVLSNPKRIEILRLCLHDNGKTQSELCNLLNLKSSTVSTYITILKSVGLVRVVRDGDQKRIKTITSKIQISILPIHTQSANR